MGFRLFHHVAVLEVMPHCDYRSSETSYTSPHSLRHSEEGSTIVLPSLPEALFGAWQTLPVHWSSGKHPNSGAKQGSALVTLNCLIHRG